MKLIIGLGNPEGRYAKTRHNLGFRLLDELAKNHQVGFSQQIKLKAEIAQLPAGNVFFVKPTTYMNESGSAVGLVANYYKVKTTDILLVSDDMNLVFGVVRVRMGGSDGGHNGLKSVISAIGQDFYRMRLGVGSPQAQVPLENFVLANFSKDEEARVPEMVNKGLNLVEDFIADQHQPQTIR